MSFLSKIFDRKKASIHSTVFDSPEVQSLFKFEQQMNTLLGQDRFIAGSDYAYIRQVSNRCITLSTSCGPQKHCRISVRIKELWSHGL